MTARAGRPPEKRFMLGDERAFKVLRNWALLGFAVAGLAMAWATKWAVSACS